MGVLSRCRHFEVSSQVISIIMGKTVSGVSPLSPAGPHPLLLCLCREWGSGDGDVRVMGMMKQRILSSHNGPAIRMSMRLTSNTFNHTTIPSNTSANRGRTVRLHSNSGGHCNNGNILGTISGMGGMVTPTVLNVDTLGRHRISRGLVRLSNAGAGSGLNTGTVLNISLTITGTTTGCLSLPLCHCVNKAGTCMLPIPVVGVVGNNSRSSTPVTFRRFVVHPIKTYYFHRNLHVKTRIFRTLGGILRSHNLDATINSRNNFTPTLSKARSTLGSVVTTVGTTKCRPNGSIAVTVSYTSSRFCRSNMCSCAGFRKTGNTGHATRRRITCLSRLITGCPVSSVRSNVSRGS